LRRIRPRWVLASSTGSALLAAAGLLRRRTAATHWLAGPLLERHGAHPSTERLVVDRPFVTCSGLASTFDAAFVVASEVGGPALVHTIREQLRDDVGRATPCDPPRTRYRSRPARRLAAVPPTRATAPPPRSGRTVIEVELDEHPPERGRGA
jgi:transcriptional regulator GlxA family with amidase domain